jgi:type II secretory pathway pseudopilin PulG
MVTKIRSPRTLGYTLLELLITCALFMILSAVLVSALMQVTTLYRRSNSRDDAVRQLLKAKTALMRDLANCSQQPGQYTTGTVPPHLGSGSDGDALTFLSSDTGSTSPTWSVSSTGQASLASEITYYLVIPTAPNAYGMTCTAGLKDSAGYEQQDPFKWLIRRVDPPPTAAPAVVSPLWLTWLTQPSSMASTATIQVVADQMFQFRVLAAAPVWNIQISAVAVSDATHQISVGSVPLEGSKFDLVEQFCVPANN